MWREEMRRAWRELRGPEVSAVRVGGAVFVGLLAGALPLLVVPTALVAAASLWFGLDALLAWVVSFADAPLLVHAVGAAEAKLGVLPVGLALATVGGIVGAGGAKLVVKPARRLAYRLPDDAPAWIHAVERVATRYADPQSASPWDRVRFHHIRGKLLADPAGMLIAELAGDAPAALGAVLDIGAGRGQLALLLLELGRAREVRGVDWDRQKIEAGSRAALVQGPLCASFSVGDAREAPFSPADTVLLIDLLHYFRPAEQDAILDRAAAAVLPGGRLLVREADPARGLRSWATWLEEGVFTLLRVNRGERVRFRPAVEIVQRLESSGLACETLRAWGKTPFSNVLVVARRAPGGSTRQT
jgi:SAM-dependent methyltransferase